MVDIRLMNQTMQLVGVGGWTPIDPFAVRESRTSAVLSWLLVAHRPPETQIPAELHPFIANGAIHSKCANTVHVVHVIAGSRIRF